MHTISLSTISTPASHVAAALTDTGPQGLAANITKDTLEHFGALSKSEQVTRIPGESSAFLMVGCGADINYRNFAAAAVRSAKDLAELVIDLTLASESEILEAAEGAALGAETPNSYKASKTKLQTVTLMVKPEFESLEIERAIQIATQVVIARELINTPANDLWPQKLAEIAANHAKHLPIEVEIWDDERLVEEKCGGILGVGRGSVRPPRLVKMTYRGGSKHLGLVGKGITFDTGGLSLKPAESMVGMKYDMAGAATVMAAILAIAQQQIPVTVTAIMCLAENMPSGQATRPGDVLKMRNGKTVEVLNTDAEGRLVLGDGLTVLAELNPDHIVDVATLTGAATIALGNRYAGLMGRGSAIELVKEAGAQVGELIWEMPLPEELRPLLDSDLADIANVKIGNRAGGMLIAGWFLSEFVAEDASWAHLDIAGPANNDNAPYGVVPKGASGVAIRTLVQLAQNLADN